MNENIEHSKKLCERFLNTSLVQNHYAGEDPGENGNPTWFMTKNEHFYFTPDMESPVMQNRLGSESIPVRFQYKVETVHRYAASHLEPEEADLVEVGRGDCLVDAVKQAILLSKEWEINGFLTNEYEAQMELENAKYFASIS